MSVIVKGMEIPQKCGQCKLYHAEHPMHCMAVEEHRTVGAPYGMSRPNWCPLVEIPTPHGRLIDADAIQDYNVETFGQRLLIIDTAPTVIEAEGGEE